jgi:hypothetical protein
LYSKINKDKSRRITRRCHKTVEYESTSDRVVIYIDVRGKVEQLLLQGVMFECLKTKASPPWLVTSWNERSEYF